MAFENLIEAVEVDAEETILGIRQRAEREVAGAKKAAVEKSQEIRGAAIEDAKRRAAVERGNLMATARKEIRMSFAVEKDRMFQKAFQEAGRRLASARADGRYARSYVGMLAEAMRDLEGEVVSVHIDKQDEVLTGKALQTLGKNCDVIADLESIGGMNVASKDGRFMVYNTLESRLEKARKVLKSEIYTILFG
jgi:V/A-type H+-transporting ATPase subunit E